MAEKEMTDLPAADRGHLMAVVFEVEAVLRDVLEPDKINVASLGNLTPHLHWHVIPRWRDDPHFPGSIWSERLREVAGRQGGANIGVWRTSSSPIHST